MKRPLRLIVITAFAMTLSACTPPEIKISTQRVGGRQVVNLIQDWGLIFSDRMAPCVVRVDVRESETSSNLIWRVEAKTNQCIKLASFTLGVVPTAFIERTPMPPSVSGRAKLVVWGVGVGEADLTLP